MAQLLQMKLDYRPSNQDTDAARAADAVMQNLDFVIPRPVSSSVQLELTQGYGYTGDPLPAEESAASRMDIQAAVEQAPQPSLQGQPQLPIGMSPFGAPMPRDQPTPAQTAFAAETLLALPSVGGAATPDAPYLLPGDGPAVPTPAGESVPASMHNKLLVALETPPPHSSFPRPDTDRSMMMMDTPATPAFLKPPTPATPSFREVAAPTSSQRTPVALTANDLMEAAMAPPASSSHRTPVSQHRTPVAQSSGRPQLASRVVLRGPSRTPRVHQGSMTPVHGSAVNAIGIVSMLARFGCAVDCASLP